MYEVSFIGRQTHKINNIDQECWEMRCEYNMGRLYVKGSLTTLVIALLISTEPHTRARNMGGVTDRYFYGYGNDMFMETVEDALGKIAGYCKCRKWSKKFVLEEAKKALNKDCKPSLLVDLQGESLSYVIPEAIDILTGNGGCYEL